MTGSVQVYLLILFSVTILRPQSQSLDDSKPSDYWSAKLYPIWKSTSIFTGQLKSLSMCSLLTIESHPNEKFVGIQNLTKFVPGYINLSLIILLGTYVD